MIWERRAEALVALGRENEAVEALETAIRHQRQALDADPRSVDYHEQLFRHHYYLVAVRCVLGQTNEAASSLEAVDPLWPASPGALFTYARDLARDWPKAPVAKGGGTKRPGTAARLYGALVVTTLERSVNAGFRDFSQLINDPAFEAFRARDDFQHLLMRTMDLAFPTDAFAR